MPLAVRKTVNFVFNRGAVAGAGADNFSAVQRGTVHVFRNDAVGFVVCISDIAVHGGAADRVVGKGERLHHRVRLLPFRFGEINRPP